MKVIVIDKNSKLLDLIKVSVEVISDIEVIPRTSCYDALAMLELIGADVKLVVIYDPGSDFKKEEVLGYVTKQLVNAQAIVVSKNLNFDHERIQIIDQVDNPDILINAIKEFLLSSSETKQLEDHHSIEFKYLEYFTVAPADIFVRLKDDSPKGHKYIKLLLEGATIEKEFIEKYKGKKLKEFFINNSDREKVHKILTRQIIAIFREGKKNKTDVKIAFDELHVQAYDQLTNLGFTPVTTKLAVETTQNLINSMHDNKNLLSSLNDIYRKGASFSYRLSYMTAIVAYSVITSFKWSTDDLVKAATYAALLGDLDLSDQFVKIRSQDDLEAANLNSVDKESIVNHAFNASRVLETMKDIPPETYKVVREHHGTLDGKGFSESIPGQVSNVSACYIAAEEFAYHILTSPTTKIDISEIVTKMRSKFMGDPTSQIEQAIRALEVAVSG